MAPFDRIDLAAYPRRAGLALAGLVAVAALAACADDEARRRRRPRGAEAAAPAAPRVRWPHLARLEELRIVRPGVRSSHLVGEPSAVIRASDAAEGYGSAAPELPEGSLLVVSHDVDGGTLHFAMERTAPRGPWSYAVVDADGWVVEAGRIPTCVRCHEEAPRDEVFGPPRGAPAAGAGDGL